MPKKKYVISRVLHGSSIKWWTWILSEYSLPNEQGNFQRVKVIADFGNTKNKENYQNAKKLKTLLEGAQ